MKVEIWSDVVCPFCYIGKRKFEIALENFKEKDTVEIEWKSFQLDRELVAVPGKTINEYLAERKGTTIEEGQRMNDGMAAIAKEVGLNYHLEKAIVANTFNAHRLLHFAKKYNKQNELKERLFAAYYTEGQNIGDVETLIKLGVEVGLREHEMRSVLTTDLYKDAVELDQYEAQQIGVRGVPFFVFNNKYAVSGAQSPEVFAELLEKVSEEEKPGLIESGAGVCSIDGTCG